MKAADPVEASRMPLLDHLRELRTRLTRSMYVLAAGVAVCFLFAQDLFHWLAQPMNDALVAHGKGSLAVTQALEGMYVQMKVAGLGGLFVASPILFWQIWGFVAPGLYEHEKKRALPLVASSTGLFVAGGAFTYYVVFRYGFPLFLKMSGEDVTPMLSIDAYLSTAITLIVAFGVAFQLPVVIWFLSRLGLVNHRDLIRGFRYSVVGIFVIAAVLTPPDVLSQLMMAAPLVVLYGVGIVVSYFASTKPVPAAGS